MSAISTSPESEISQEIASMEASSYSKQEQAMCLQQATAALQLVHCLQGVRAQIERKQLPTQLAQLVPLLSKHRMLANGNLAQSTVCTDSVKQNIFSAVSMASKPAATPVRDGLPSSPDSHFCKGPQSPWAETPETEQTSPEHKYPSNQLAVAGAPSLLDNGSETCFIAEPSQSPADAEEAGKNLKVGIPSDLDLEPIQHAVHHIEEERHEDIFADIADGPPITALRHDGEMNHLDNSWFHSLINLEGGDHQALVDNADIHFSMPAIREEGSQQDAEMADSLTTSCKRGQSSEPSEDEGQGNSKRPCLGSSRQEDLQQGYPSDSCDASPIRAGKDGGHQNFRPPPLVIELTPEPEVEEARPQVSPCEGASDDQFKRPSPKQRRGTATDRQSVAARQRRERISQRIKALQELVPNGKKMDTASMLDQAIGYLTSLQHQIHMKQLSRQAARSPRQPQGFTSSHFMK